MMLITSVLAALAIGYFQSWTSIDQRASSHPGVTSIW